MEYSLYVCLAAAVLLMICILVLLSLYRRLQLKYESIQESYQHLEALNGTLRAQRHDYLNHLQVVYGMMELEEYGELHDYLEPVYQDMMKTGKALKTSIPAVNALLKAKMAEAENKGIDFYVEVKSDLKGLKIEAWELCKVLSNLLDNAMAALLEKNAERKLMVDVTEDAQAYIFSVQNNGPMIPVEIQDNIFKQGFTTKQGSDHGMGLYIVSEVLRKNSGTVELTSNDEETVFAVRFLKKSYVN